MSHKYLGAHFDIHTGGIDHVPIHHENEIAQSEAYTGAKTVNYWLHNEFMQVDGGKMSKSQGTAYTLDDLAAKGYSAMELRCFCHSAHYRKALNFTWDGMQAAKVTYARLQDSMAAHKQSKARIDNATLAPYSAQFDQAITDDLNTPLALGVLHTLLKLPHSHDVYQLELQFDSVLGLQLDLEQPASLQAVPDDIAVLALQRWQAKAARDFGTADALRARIKALGYDIKDQKDDYTISPTT
jgi:cysteinyl-tRNA synthetase